MKGFHLSNNTGDRVSMSNLRVCLEYPSVVKIDILDEGGGASEAMSKTFLGVKGDNIFQCNLSYPKGFRPKVTITPQRKGQAND